MKSMISKSDIICKLAESQFEYTESISYISDDPDMYTLVFTHDTIRVFIDVNLCKETKPLFSYYDYVNIQNHYVNISNLLYRFYIETADDLKECLVSLELLLSHNEIDNIREEKGHQHIDSTPTEHQFELLFSKIYGPDAMTYLEKEYSLTTLNGNTLYSDYVLETLDEKYAIEENGIFYHHPQIIGREQYKNQLERQNTLAYYRFKVYRWSSEHIAFADVMEDNIQNFFGKKSRFINQFSLSQNRKFELYEHQIDSLKTIEVRRKDGCKAFLIVIPTAAGKSQIALEDISRLYLEKHQLRVLIISPGTQIRNDWEKRIESLKKKIEFCNETYVGAYHFINQYSPDYFDYIIIDEAHHAVTPTCKKIIQYFTPEFMLGLTATPERLDRKKLEEVFGSYTTKMTLQEAIEKRIVSPIRAFRIESSINLSEVRYNGVDYRNSDIEKTVRVDSRNELIVQVLQKYFTSPSIRQKQGIIFCVNINHAKEMERVCTKYGIKTKAIYGGNRNNEAIIEQYRSRQIQFLCSCSMISEGWDEPQTEVVVMARPTLSKVLYLQQLGRGLRKCENKEALYVIDVVDQYGSLLKPWTVNSLFHLNMYKPFGDIFQPRMTTEEMTLIQGLSEEEIAIREIDIETFEEKYKDYLSVEQTARQLFLSTGTVTSWINKHEIRPAVSLKIANTNVYLFSPSQIEEIRIQKGLKERNENTIKDDFFEFLEEKSYTFSFKMVFLLALIKLVSKEGEADVDQVLDLYIQFYQDRINHNIPVDKNGCIYTAEFLKDRTEVKRNMFANPFEKFERKRFIYHSRDLNKIAINPSLWNKMTADNWNKVKKMMSNHLSEYYEKYGGLTDIRNLE